MTTTITYKEVFQLAQDKGYKMSSFHKLLYNNPKSEIVLNLCNNADLHNIQKWLRDEHKIFVQIELVTPYDLKLSVYGEGMVLHYATLKFSVEQYEHALLEGINEALNLI